MVQGIRNGISGKGIGKISESGFDSQVRKTDKNKQNEFKDVLKEQIETPKINFSDHAEKRLSDRGIKINEKGLKCLGDAVEKVGRKGGRQALILLDEVAMVVGVRKRTVITALPEQEANDRVFTNIDSVVITKSKGLDL